MADERLYAHAIIELEDGTRIPRGQEITKIATEIAGIDELTEAGSVSSKPYDETKDQLPPPDEVEIEGYVYKRASEQPATVGETGARE